MTNPRTTRRFARDGVTPEDIAEFGKYLVGMSGKGAGDDAPEIDPAMAAELFKALSPYLDSGTAEAVKSCLERQIGGALAIGSDEPPGFSGRPRPGGGMDPLKAQDRRLAADARRGGTFAERHPQAAMIQVW